MNNVLVLAYLWKDCPEYWKNFVRHTRKSTTQEDISDILNQAILEQHGVYVNSRNETQKSFVIFKSAAYKNWFLLRWE